MDTHKQNERCPNCGARSWTGEEQCVECGWMPLRPTELCFVEDEQVVCPKCSMRRSVSVAACQKCGDSHVLATPTEHTYNFHLSSMFAVTTAVAICVALARVSIFLGVSVFAFVCLAAPRTALLVRERKRHRYPVTANDVWSMFGMSVLGIGAAITVFLVTASMGGFFVGVLVGPLFYHSYSEVIVLAAILIVSHVACGALLFRKSNHQRIALIGAIAALIFGAPVCLFLTVRHPLAGLLLLIPIAAIVAGALRLACRRQDSHLVKGFVFGFSASISAIGFLTLIRFGRGHDVSLVFACSGLFLVPVLLSVMVLDQIWNWDDAFPYAASRARTYPPPRRLPSVVRIDDEEGIEFQEEAAS